MEKTNKQTQIDEVEKIATLLANAKFLTDEECLYKEVTIDVDGKEVIVKYDEKGCLSWEIRETKDPLDLTDEECEAQSLQIHDELDSEISSMVSDKLIEYSLTEGLFEKEVKLQFFNKEITVKLENGGTKTIKSLKDPDVDARKATWIYDRMDEWKEYFSGRQLAMHTIHRELSDLYDALGFNR